jgi:hypothetical protein
MEPRPDEKKDQQPRPDAQPAKPRRFRVIKLEERIAPKKLGTYYGPTCVDCYTLPPNLCKK